MWQEKKRNEKLITILLINFIKTILIGFNFFKLKSYSLTFSSIAAKGILQSAPRPLWELGWIPIRNLSCHVWRQCSSLMTFQMIQETPKPLAWRFSPQEKMCWVPRQPGKHDATPLTVQQLPHWTLLLFAWESRPSPSHLFDLLHLREAFHHPLNGEQLKVQNVL